MMFSMKTYDVEYQVESHAMHVYPETFEQSHNTKVLIRASDSFLCYAKTRLEARWLFGAMASFRLWA